MVFFAVRALKVFQQKIVVLLLLCSVTLCLGRFANAVQSNSVSAEQRNQQMECNSKNIWDILQATSGWGVAFIGVLATYVYNRRQQEHEKAQNERQQKYEEAQREKELEVSRVQTVSNLLPQLQSTYIEDIELAIKLVIELKNIELATDLLKRYETGVAIPIFQKLVSSSNDEIAKEAKESLRTYLEPLKLSEARERLIVLIKKFAKINESETAGLERTLKMESIVLDIRKHALVAFPLLPELTSDFSPSADLVSSLIEKMKKDPVPDYPKLPELEMPDQSRDWSADGKRLAAVVILQVQPSRSYLDWLATVLVREEGSFLGYHTSVALLNAVYSLNPVHYADLRRVVEFTREKAKELHPEKNVLEKDPFKKVLSKAEAMLQKNM